MWQTYPKVVQKWPKAASFELFFFTIFSNTVLTVRTKFSAVNLHHIRVLCVRWHQNRISVIWPTAKSSSKWPGNGQLWTLLIFFWKRQCNRTKFSTVFLHPFRALCVQWHKNCMTVIWQTAKSCSKWSRNGQLWTISFFSLKTSLRSNEFFYSLSTPF